jgi:hypothetical protein
MKSSNLTLGAVLNSPKQYVIPVFQHYYRWDQPEWEKLWDDLAELQHPGRTGSGRVDRVEQPSAGDVVGLVLFRRIQQRRLAGGDRLGLGQGPQRPLVLLLVGVLGG